MRTGKILAVAAAILGSAALTPPAIAQGSDAFIGEIIVFPYNFCPRGWLPTNGQLLSISQNTALYSLLGTTFGGDGNTTFALPDLRGRATVGVGAGPGLTVRQQGQFGGNETVALTDPSQNAPHTHAAYIQTTNLPADTNQPRTNAFGLADGNVYVNKVTPQFNPMNTNTVLVRNSGNGTAHPNMQPFLVLNSCIAIEGIYPSRS